MKQSIFHIFLILLISLAIRPAIWAQDDKSSVIVEIDKKVDADVVAKIKAKTESILNEKTTAFRNSVSKYQAMQKRGEIGKEEMERKIEQEAERYEKDIENEVENLEFVIRRELSKETGSIDIDMEDLADLGSTIYEVEVENGDGDEMDSKEERGDMGMPGDTTGENHSFKIKLPKGKSEKKFLAGMTIAFGLNYLTTDEPSASAYYPDFQFAKSNYFEIGYLASSRIGGPGSHFYLNYGLSYNHLNLDMDGNSIISHNDDSPIFIAAAPNIKNSIFDVNYLTIPITIRLGSKGSEGFGLELGGYGGIRIGAHQEYTYKSLLEEDVTVTTKHSYGLNRFTAGLTGAIGWRWFNLFARYDLIPLFEDHDVYDYQAITAGIRFNIL